MLQYVALPRFNIDKKPTPAVSKVKRQHRSDKPDGNGRDDLIFLFNFLRNKSVKRIIRVTVDDMAVPGHSDEAIEKSLAGFKVEVWDWQKLDVCIATVIATAPEVREITLYWSGNNAVLWGWSGEQGGLCQLKNLRKVYIHVEQVRNLSFPQFLSILILRISANANSMETGPRVI